MAICRQVRIMNGFLSRWSFTGGPGWYSPLTRTFVAGRRTAGLSPAILPFPPSSHSMHSHCTEGDSADSRYSSSTSPLFDFSEYLLSGCRWKHAPPFPDFVGPVLVQPTHDCRGRGLFTSADVRAGDILVVSNPFALAYNDPYSIRLYTMITSVAKQSSKALYQLASLAGYRDEIIIPTMEIFDSNFPYCDFAALEMLEYDPQRIVNIMKTNCFGGEVRLSDSEPATQLNGLWLLPSFINHSCAPNASRFFVGKAMLILASTDIQANEEITISYTDCFLPVRMREEKLESLGCEFFCECQRCILERSLQEQLLDVSDPFQALHAESFDEVFFLAKKKGHPPASMRACTELCRLFGILAKKLESCDGVTFLQKQWILASYSDGILGKCFADHLSGGQKPSPCRRALDLVESMRCTIPGMMCTLSFIMVLASSAKQQGGNVEMIQRLESLAMDECARIYGKQRLDVTRTLMEQSLDAIPFV